MKASDLGFGEGKSLGLVGGAGLLKNGVTNGVSMDLGEYIQTAIRKAQEADQLRAQLSHEITLRGKIQRDANQQDFFPQEGSREP
jgi:hypothetical protein